jgi:hypothetical protein
MLMRSIVVAPTMHPAQQIAMIPIGLLVYRGIASLNHSLHLTLAIVGNFNDDTRTILGDRRHGRICAAYAGKFWIFACLLWRGCEGASNANECLQNGLRRRSNSSLLSKSSSLCGAGQHLCPVNKSPIEKNTMALGINMEDLHDSYDQGYEEMRTKVVEFLLSLEKKALKDAEEVLVMRWATSHCAEAEAFAKAAEMIKQGKKIEGGFEG